MPFSLPGCIDQEMHHIMISQSPINANSHRKDRIEMPWSIVCPRKQLVIALHDITSPDIFDDLDLRIGHAEQYSPIIPYPINAKESKLNQLSPKQDLEVGWVGRVVVKEGLAQSGH